MNASFSNTAFVGIPVCTALWGARGALLAALFDQGLNFPLLTLAPLGYSKSISLRSWRQVFLSPLLVGMALGILCSALRVELPSWLGEPLSALGGITTPLALVLVGAMARPARLETRMLSPLAAYLTPRLAIVPLAVIGMAKTLGLEVVGAGVIVIQSAMPASVLATVMAEEYGADGTLAATGACLSVFLSFLTVPIFATMVGVL